jgi:hypothetical protein
VGLDGPGSGRHGCVAEEQLTLQGKPGCFGPALAIQVQSWVRVMFGFLMTLGSQVDPMKAGSLGSHVARLPTNLGEEPGLCPHDEEELQVLPPVSSKGLGW